MKKLLRVFSSVHILISVLFGCTALILVVMATAEVWRSVGADWDRSAAQGVIEAIGLLAAALVALQMAETIAEEEVIRIADVSAPTRVRRYLSRFMVVIVVALAIEGLVATFKAVHEDLSHLPFAAALVAATAFMIAGWGAFVRWNRSAEELEPEAMQEAKQEDKKLET